jgi:hypothetical protein
MDDAVLILRNARVAALDRDRPEATALAVRKVVLWRSVTRRDVNADPTVRTKLIDGSGRPSS